MAIFQHCKKCGAEILAQAKICPHCKTVLKKDEPPKPPKPPKQPPRRDWETIQGVSGGHRVRRRGKVVFFLAIAVVGWIIYASQKTSIEASRAEYGAEWGFTTPNLKVACRNHRYADGTVRPHVVARVDGREYALNGAARGAGLYADGRAVMKPNPWKYGATQSLIDKGLGLCR